MTQWGLDTIFNPAKRHMDDEKRRLQSTREEVGDNSGGKRIDFESGKVKIPGAAEGADAQPAADGPATGPDDAASGDAARRVAKDAAGKSVAGKGAAAKGAAGESAEPTAAQVRAAARRGRKLG